MAAEHADAAADTTPLVAHSAMAPDAYVLEQDPDFLCRPLCVAACAESTVISHESTLAKSRPDETIRYPQFGLSNTGTAKALDLQIETRLIAERLRYEHRGCVDPTKHCERSLEIACRSVFASSRVISIGCLEEYFLGGAHPTREVFTLNYALRSGEVKQLRLADLFEPTAAWRPEVLRLYREVLRARIDRFFGPDLTYADPEVPEPFLVSCHGLHLVNTDMPFAIGSIDALVPWTRLGPWLAATGPATALRVAP